MEHVPICNVYLQPRASHRVLIHFPAPVPLPQGISRSCCLEKPHRYPCFSPMLGFCAKESVIAPESQHTRVNGSRQFQNGDKADTGVVAFVHSYNRKLSLYRPNKLLSNFLAPPQSLPLHLSITHKHLSRKKLCSLEPSEQNVEKPETTSVFNTRESIVPSPEQINFFHPLYYFSSDNVSSDVIPGLISGSFDALKFPKEQYSTFAHNPYLHVYIPPFCLQGIVSYDLPMFM